jgi:riboflavin kinase/FMN adenylyltransferase
VVTVGVFDGVHLGHKKIIRRVVNEAKSLNTKSIVLTFEPHPTIVLGKGRFKGLLTTIDERLKLIAELGINEVIIAKFTPQLAALSPRDFVEQILLGRLGARVVVVGTGFVFGRGRTGDINFLLDIGPQLNLKVVEVPLELKNGKIISSTLIREAIEQGKVEEACELLGYVYMLRGKVIRGHGRGGPLLGIPTANIQVPEEKVRPATGVYAGWARVGNQEWRSVINIGRIPTFGDVEAEQIHVHLIGFKGDLYGREIVIGIEKRIRNEYKFKNHLKLAERIKQDIKVASENKRSHFICAFWKLGTESLSFSRCISSVFLYAKLFV